MTLNQILRRIRRQPAEPELSPEARAFIDARKGALEGLSRAELDERTSRYAAEHEAEVRQAIREMDDPRAKTRTDG